MPWVRIDDSFYDHPKFVGVSLAAVGVWTIGLAWANKHATDGIVPGRFFDRHCQPDLLDELVAAGLLERVDGDYRYHDFHDYQPTGETTRQRRREISTARAEAGRKGAAARWQNQKPETEEPPHTGEPGWQNGKRDGKPMAPTRPVPQPPLATDKVIHNATVLLAKHRGWKSHRAAITHMTADGTIDQLTELHHRFPHAPADHLTQMLDNGPLLARYVKDSQ
jgi:hypothetical protein